MKRILLFLLLISISNGLFAQSDGCSAATLISVTANCASPSTGTTIGATETIPGCTGNADDDVWYQFVATNTSTQINVTAGASFDPVVQLFSGACASLSSLICKDDFGSGVTETINYSGLTIGQTYRIRVFHYGLGTGSGDFTICVTNPPAAPVNNECAGATNLTVNTSCTYSNSTTNGATQSAIGCSGTADDDVWFTFTASNSVQTISVHPLSSLDLVVQVYSGTCASLSTLDCEDATFTGQDEIVSLVGLVAGQVYRVRVYDYYAGTTGNFQICVTGAATPAPINDEPCNAIQVPTVTSTCQYLQFTNVGATATMSAPTPSSCVGGGGLQQGGFSATSKDVWFQITVPSSGSIQITSKPNMGVGSITDGVMALYSGTCSALTQIACSDDHAAYPGATNDFLPMISASGLTPGTTVYLRYFGFGSSTGSFGFCVTTTTNDNCANALYICDINGFSASTSAAYTPDRPCNMRGNNEDINGVNQPDGINTGGIFGQAGAWGTGSPAFDVIINNNSWIKFTASATAADLQVSIYDCWVGNYPSGGIQMQIFSGTNCCDFVPVSNFQESSTGFTITANNLTIGNDYYLMVDGYAGDICNYTITAQSGVQFPDIADVPAICPGQSVVLTAPVGATSYEWQHNGATTQSVTVTPGTTQTYFCEVTGLCGYKQMLDVLVTVNPTPVVSISNGASTSICNGQTVNLTATGATTYSWNTGQTGNSIGASPTINTTYTVTGTSLGCTASDIINVQVNPLPTLTVTPSSVNANCGASNGALNGTTVSGAAPISYIWTNGSGTTVGTTANLINIPAGAYFLNVSDGNSCSAGFGPFNVINPGAPGAPTITVDDATPCLNGSASFTATYSDPSAVFTWSGPSGFTSSNPTLNFANASPSNDGNYCVYATVAGCSGPSSCQSLIIQAPPSIDISIDDADSIICENNSFTVTASGAANYSWTGPNSFTSSSSSFTLNNAQPTFEGYYIVNATDANSCTNEDSIFVSIATLPILAISTSANNAIYCFNALINLSVSGANSYAWTGPNSFNSFSANPSIFNATTFNEGWYYVSGIDQNACLSADSIFVSVEIPAPAAASSNDTIICPGEPLALYSSGGQSFQWEGPLNFTSNLQNTSITSTQIANSGWYTVVVTDINGCTASDSILISIENNEDCLFIPTLLTPDLDGHNDLWEISGIENFEKAEVEIYNRWGNLLYYSSPYNNDWNGTVNRGTTIDGADEKVPVGTYFFIIRLNNEEETSYKGYIEVQY